MKGRFMTPILSKHEKYTTTYNIVHGYSYSNMHINTTYILSKLPLMHHILSKLPLMHLVFRALLHFTQLSD